MNAKEFMDRACRLDLRISNKEEQLQRLRALTQRVTVSYGREAVAHSRNVDSMADQLARISELEVRLRGMIGEMVNVRREIMETIEQVPDLECQTILELRYLCMKPWNAICEQMRLSRTKVYNLHVAALNMVGRILEAGSREQA